jgi:hypothetical protein
MAHGKSKELAAINKVPVVRVLVYARPPRTLVRDRNGPIVASDGKRYSTR